MVYVWMMTAVSPRVSDLVSSVGRVSIIMLHRMYAWQGFCAYILDLRVNIFISFFWRITDNQGNASSIHFLHIFLLRIHLCCHLETTLRLVGSLYKLSISTCITNLGELTPSTEPERNVYTNRG